MIAVRLELVVPSVNFISWISKISYVNANNVTNDTLFICSSSSILYLRWISKISYVNANNVTNDTLFICSSSILYLPSDFRVAYAANISTQPREYRHKDRTTTPGNTARTLCKQ